MKSLIESLSSPHVVAHIQWLCGVQWKYPDERNPIFPSTGLGKDGEAIVVRNKLFYRAMQLGSQLAGEPFYYLFTPACCWILDIAIARKTLTNLALVMYIGQSAKDILRRNRPPSPPVIRLEKLYETEYGMPSTHTMAGTVAPFALYVFSRQLYKIPDRQCFVVATIWAAWVGCSRIYLGMHTLSQVLVGAIGAGGLLYSAVSLENKFDEVLVNSNTATACMAAASVALSCFIFCLDTGTDPETGKPRWNTARGDQAEIMGFTTGFLVGSKWGISQNLYRYLTPGNACLPIPFSNIKGNLIRFFVGGLILIPTSVILRKISLILFAKLAGVSIKDRVTAKRHPTVELPYKFTFSFVIATVGTSLLPCALQGFGLW